MPAASAHFLDGAKEIVVQDAQSTSQESQNASLPTSPEADTDLHEDSQDSASAQLHKRRRVTRACDECRRKKIKCDGKQPCTHCTVYSYECSYDQPSNRRRNPAPQLLEAAERKLHRAEALLKICLPTVNLDDPGLDSILENGTIPGPNQDKDTATTIKQLLSHQPQENQNSTSGAPPDPNLESMVRSTGQLDVDESGHWDYYGHSSGLNFLRRMGEEFGSIARPEQLGDKALNSFKAQRQLPNSVIGSPISSRETPSEATLADDLPPKSVALELCSNALDDACAIMCCLHAPTFYRSLDRIYDRPFERYENEDHRFLPLIYTVMALGCLFAKGEQSTLDRKGYATATDEGYKYFWASRQLMDVTDCRDLTSLQALIHMIMFLQCSAKLSTCYSFIGVALRSALRMGLHRSFSDSFNPIEAEMRRRCFWIIRKMDIFVGAMLGLPQTLSDEDIDQEYPSKVDDEGITENGICLPPPGQTPLAVAAIANFRLTPIVEKIMRNIYPIKGFQSREGNPNKAYSVSYAVIRDIENELQDWLDKLPTVFTPGGNAPRRVLRIQQLLRMSYAHVQMMLYRPFLHYVSGADKQKLSDQRAYACAAACVSVSRNIIHITAEMKRNGLLAGSYWFTMYTTFFAILTLVYYALENAGISKEMMQDAIEGQQTLAALAKRSMAADRTSTILAVMFDHLAKSKKAKGPLTSSAKRRIPGTGIRSSSVQDVQSQGPNPVKTHTPHTKSSARQYESSHEAVQSAASAQEDANLSQNGQTGGKEINPEMGFPSDTVSDIVNDPSVAHTSMSSQPQFMSHSPSVVAPQTQEISGTGDFDDLSAMMFPSSDPLAYPKQPMLTLEQSGNQSQADPFSEGFNPFIPASTEVAGTVHADDQIDVQMFGPMPSYMQHQGDVGMGGFGSSATAFSNPDGLWDNQDCNQAVPNMRFDDILPDADWGLS